MKKYKLLKRIVQLEKENKKLKKEVADLEMFLNGAVMDLDYQDEEMSKVKKLVDGWLV